MKRLLLVAHDRALTRFMAESILQRSLDAFVPLPDDPWDISRAHSASEAMVLVQHSAPFSTIVVDVQLPDATSMELVERIRKNDSGAQVPIILITERGRDTHNRRVATEKFRVNGFLERPVTAESLSEGLRRLERRRRILLVEPDELRAERYAERMERIQLTVERCRQGREALREVPRFQPDLVAIALDLEDCSGSDLCAEIKRTGSDDSVPVVLYGLLSALPAQAQNENAYRADDFIPAPFDDGILVERVMAQIGIGGPASTEPPTDELPESSTAENEVASPDLPTRPGGPQGVHKAPTVSSPPPSASPAAVGPTQRSNRRVPCNVSLRVREGDRFIESQTLDISHGGIFFELESPPSVGSLVDLTFELPNTGRTLNAVGKVAWQGPKGVGVKFSRIDKNDLQVIVDYVNRVSRVLYAP